MEDPCIKWIELENADHTFSKKMEVAGISYHNKLVNADLKIRA